VSRTVKVRGSVENRERKLKGRCSSRPRSGSREHRPADPGKALLLVGANYYVFVEEKPAATRAGK